MKETLADKPLDLEIPICQQTGLVIGWASQTLLTCNAKRARQGRNHPMDVMFSEM